MIKNRKSQNAVGIASLYNNADPDNSKYCSVICSKNLFSLDQFKRLNPSFKTPSTLPANVGSKQLI